MKGVNVGEKNITDAIVDYLFDTTFEDIDEQSIERAKERLIDSVGVFSVGKRAAGNDDIIGVIKDSGGTEQSLIYTYGTKTNSENAAFANSILLRSFDFEAIDAEALDPDGPTTAAHISSTTVPAMLAVADAVGCTGKEALRALILADDVVARALNASHFSVHDMFDGNGTANALGAAIAAGLLYGLNKEQMKNAITLVFNQMSGSMQNVFEKKMTFKIPNALTARAGVFSAKLAKAGYGPCLDDPIAGPRGFFESFYSEPKPEEMLDQLGEHFIADIVIKPWPCCRATHASIDATLKALDGRTLTADEVSHMKIVVPPGAKNFVGKGYEFGMDKSYQGAFSIDFLCATAVLHGNVTTEYEEAKYMLAPELGELLAKTEVAPEMPAGTSSFNADCYITLTDGTVLEGHCTYPYGDLYRSRMTDEDFYAKFWNNINYGNTISKENAQELIDRIKKLEDEPNMSDLLALMA